MKQSIITHLQLARISNIFTIPSNILTGTILAAASLTVDESAATGLLTESWLPLLYTTLGACLIYIAGMYWNDYFDRHFDTIHKPERPIPGGRIRPITVAVFASVYMTLAMILFSLVGPATFSIGVMLIATVFFYDISHRNIYSPFVMAINRCLVYGLAFSVFDIPNLTLILPLLMVLMYLTGLTIFAGYETRKLESLPLLSIFFLGAPAIILALQSDENGMFALSIPVLLLFWTLRSIVPVFRQSKKTDLAVADLIAGICLLDAAIIHTTGLNPLLLINFLCFGLTLLLQKWIRGS